MEGLIGLFRWRDWAKYGADSQLSASLMYSETVAKSCHAHDCVWSMVEGYKHPICRTLHSIEHNIRARIRHLASYMRKWKERIAMTEARRSIGGAVHHGRVERPATAMQVLALLKISLIYRSLNSCGTSKYAFELGNSRACWNRYPSGLACARV